MTERKNLRWLVHTSSALLMLGCASTENDLKLRIVDSQRPTGIGSAGLAEANNLLGLKNTGLALEAFRKLQREDPSADALSGIAACYAAMGRDDLAKTNLELALAMTPNSPELLQSIAAVMDRLGLKSEAAEARLQAAAAVSLTTASQPTTPLAQAEKSILYVSSVASPYPPAPGPSANTVNKLETVGTTPRSPSEAKIADVDQKAHRMADTSSLSNSVTVKLPPVRLASTAGRAAAPRLERISEKEVVLVTSAKPFWAPLQGTGVSLATLQRRRPSSESGEPNVRLLNAARVPRLAGLARATLMQRGWRKIEVGDHATIRSTSIVLYPADKQRLGRSLARHFGIRAMQAEGTSVTVILGRDLRDRIHG